MFFVGGGNGYRAGKYGGGAGKTKKYRVVGIDVSGNKTLLTIQAETEAKAGDQARANGYPNTLDKWIMPATKATTSIINDANVNSVSDKQLDKEFGAKESKRKKKQ